MSKQSLSLEQLQATMLIAQAHHHLRHKTPLFDDFFTVNPFGLRVPSIHHKLTHLGPGLLIDIQIKVASTSPTTILKPYIPEDSLEAIESIFYALGRRRELSPAIAQAHSALLAARENVVDMAWIEEQLFRRM